MSLTFEKKPLLLGLSGGVAINAAIVAMNTLPTKTMQKGFGVPLFTLGWILVIMGFLNNTTRQAKYGKVLAASSVGVYSMAMMARMLMDSGNTGTPLKLTKLKFVLCWLVVGAFMGMKTGTDDSDNVTEIHSPAVHALGLLPPVLVIVGMMSVNLLERPRGIASGPGLPIFMMAWVVLSLVNSLTYKGSRQMAIDDAAMKVNNLKLKHHEIIVDALKNGATEEEHASLLESKRFEVTQLMLEIEAELGIVFDKEDVTRERPVVVLEQ